MRCWLMILMAMLSYLVSADTKLHAEASFEQLKKLEGDWKKEHSDGQDFYISFRVTAGGSVLVEDWIYKNQTHSMTLYHLDQNKLLATHYCPQGNQPRMKLEPKSVDHLIAFTFQDATNLPDINANHQHALAFKMIDENTMMRKETYRKGGEEEPGAMKLVRK